MKVTSLAIENGHYADKYGKRGSQSDISGLDERVQSLSPNDPKHYIFDKFLALPFFYFSFTLV